MLAIIKTQYIYILILSNKVLPLCHVMVLGSMSSRTNLLISSVVSSLGFVFLMPSLCKEMRKVVIYESDCSSIMLKKRTSFILYMYMYTHNHFICSLKVNKQIWRIVVPCPATTLTLKRSKVKVKVTAWCELV